MYVAVLIPPLRLFRLGGESRHDALRLFLHLLLHLGLSRKAFLSETLAGKAVMARTLPLRIVHATDNKRNQADRAVPLFVIDQFEVQQLPELSGRYLVGVQVLLVLVIPIEFDSAGHRPILYRNVYTLRIGYDPRVAVPGLSVRLRELPT